MPSAALLVQLQTCILQVILDAGRWENAVCYLPWDGPYTPPQAADEFHEVSAIAGFRDAMEKMHTGHRPQVGSDDEGSSEKAVRSKSKTEKKKLAAAAKKKAAEAAAAVGEVAKR